MDAPFLFSLLSIKINKCCKKNQPNLLVIKICDKISAVRIHAIRLIRVGNFLFGNDLTT